MTPDEGSLSRSHVPGDTPENKQEMPSVMPVRSYDAVRIDSAFLSPTIAPDDHC
jgi:hypothetical protein